MKSNYLSRLNTVLTCGLLALFISNSALAVTVWDEAVNGDLPGLSTIPTTTMFGPLGPGSYTFIGSVGVSGEIIDVDVISFTTTNSFTIDIDAMSGDDFLVRWPTSTGSFTSALTSITSAPDVDIFDFLTTSSGDWYIDLSPGLNVDGQFSEYTLTINVAPVPVPAAAWLFGSGLLGLVGMARCKRAA